MNIYVDELPKSCRDCSFQCYGSCLGGRDILNGDPYTGICHLKRQKPTDCPLKPLSDRLAEERKRVVQEIKNYVCNKNTHIDEEIVNGNHTFFYSIHCRSFLKKLDQIERGE